MRKFRILALLTLVFTTVLWATLIEHFSFPDDRKKILVVYEYADADVNISAINYGDKLPKYGNLVTILAGNFDPIRFVAWHGDTVHLYVKDAQMYELSDYLNKGAAYKVDFVDVRQSKVPDESRSYEDPWIDSLIKEKGVKTKAVITKIEWPMRFLDKSG